MVFSCEIFLACFTLPHDGFLKKPKHDTLCIFIADKLHQVQYTGLLLGHASAIEGSHPQGVHFTEEVFVQRGRISGDMQDLSFN
jgi:hypothetical protein